MDDLKREFIAIVQTQCLILDLKKGRTESMFAMRDAFKVNEKLMILELESNENKDVLDLVSAFLEWQYYSSPKPSWA